MSEDNSALAHARQGETYRMMGIRDQVKDPFEVFRAALDEFSKAINDPTCTDLAWVYAHRGATYFQLGLLGETLKYQEAIEDFKSALELKENYAWAYAQQGETYRWMGISTFLEPPPKPVEYFEKSVAAFDRAIELTSDYAWAYAHRGAARRFLFPKPPIKAAIDDLSMAVGINPDYAWAYAYRAVLHRMAKEFENAYEDLEEAARLYPDVFYDYLEIELPDYKVPSHIIGFMGFSLEQLEEAKRQLDKQPDNLFALYLVALDKFLKGGFPAAKDDINKGRAMEIL